MSHSEKDKSLVKAAAVDIVLPLWKTIWTILITLDALLILWSFMALGLFGNYTGGENLSGFFIYFIVFPIASIVSFLCCLFYIRKGRPRGIAMKVSCVFFAVFSFSTVFFGWLGVVWLVLPVIYHALRIPPAAGLLYLFAQPPFAIVVSIISASLNIRFFLSGVETNGGSSVE